MRLKGILAALLVAAIAGVFLPAIRVVDIPPGRLLAARGAITALGAVIWLLASGGKLRGNKLTPLLLPLTGVASAGLFMGIALWGVLPTIMVVAATPLINLTIDLLFGRKSATGLQVVAALGLIIGLWVAAGTNFHISPGAYWAIAGTLANAVLYELFALLEDEPDARKCMWGGLGMVVTGLATSYTAPSSPITPGFVVTILGFGLFGGLLYWLANLWVFQYCSKNAASIFLQLEVITVVAGGMITLHDRVSHTQWVGILIACVACAAMGFEKKGAVTGE